VLFLFYVFSLFYSRIFFFFSFFSCCWRDNFRLNDEPIREKKNKSFAISWDFFHFKKLKNFFLIFSSMDLYSIPRLCIIYSIFLPTYIFYCASIIFFFSGGKLGNARQYRREELFSSSSSSSSSCSVCYMCNE
jgi:hypothetical protein